MYYNTNWDIYFNTLYETISAYLANTCSVRL